MSDSTRATARPRTIVEKIWDEHLVVRGEHGAPDVLGVDLHLVHEVTSPQAFDGLRQRGLRVRRPGQTLATVDHSIPTTDRSLPIVDQLAAAQVARLEENCAEFGIPLHGIGSPHQGIVHVIGPELGLTQPGMTIVCGDSHTATHGAFGALAFGIGTSEVEQVLATQTLLQRRPRTFEVRVEGRLGQGVTAKDVILALLARIGIGGGTGHVFEYTGDAIRALSMEQRMTICNMSIEGGARAGLIAPDDTTFDYLAGRPHAPAGAAWDEAGRSMCIAMNGDELSLGQYAVSTSNRNFEGRQGKGGRTFLASPLTAAASAVNGCITDVRTRVVHEALFSARARDPSMTLTIDLGREALLLPDGASVTFPIDAFSKRCLYQ